MFAVTAGQMAGPNVSAGQMTGPNGLKFFEGTQEYPWGKNKPKKTFKKKNFKLDF